MVKGCEGCLHKNVCYNVSQRLLKWSVDRRLFLEQTDTPWVCLVLELPFTMLVRN